MSTAATLGRAGRTALPPPLPPAAAPAPLRCARSGENRASLTVRLAVLNFARTKIARPHARPGAMLARPGLQDRLVQALSQRALVLLTAAAGFGKTTALDQALDLLPAGTAVAWIGCDEHDTPLQLFSCLVAALEPFDLPWRAAPEALIAAALASSDDAGQTRALRHMATELINALDACDVAHGVIAVDDLHRVEHAAVFEFLDLLLERFTPRWTLVVASRQEPPIALARLRARGQLAEFSAADLRFDPVQTHELTRRLGLDVDAEALFTRTDGWPAGLQLALNVLLASGAAGASLASHAPAIDRRVFEFLAAEVLDRLPSALRDFLVTTSVLPELTAARCAALTGDARAAAHLEEIERHGLFVTSLPTTHPGLTLRLHDLFRDALEHRLLRERPGEVPQLLERAARSEPDGVRRLGYWLRARDWDGAARELHLQTCELLTAGQSATVERWLARFPPALLSTQPDLLLVRCLLAWMHWRWRDMIAASHAAVQAFESAGRPLDAMAARGYAVQALRGGGQRAASDALAVQLHAEVEAMLADRAEAMRAGTRWDGQEPGILAALLERESAVWAAFDDARLDDLAAPIARSIDLLDHAEGIAPFFQMLPLPAYVGLRGMRPVLARYVRKARERLHHDDTQLGTLVQALDGSLRLWAGEVRAGHALLREAAAEVRWHDFPLRSTDHVHPFLCIADVLLGDGPALLADAAVLEQTLRRAAELPDIGHRIASELFFTGRWLHAGGFTAEALRLWRLVAGWDEDPRTRPLWQRQLDTLPAFIALAEGRLGAAEQGFAAAIDRHGVQLELQGQLSELRLRAAALRLQLGGTAEDAAALLRPLFARHAGDADIAPVWLVGPALLHALATAHWRVALAPDEIATLARWAEAAAALRGQPAAMRSAGTFASASASASAAPSMPPPGAAAHPAAAGLLSEREIDVLERIAAGDSNKLIARAFDLSPHTVKRHVANILDKLDLRSRGQAAAWYRDQGSPR